MTEELKPCPFCGRKATIASWWSYIEGCWIARVACKTESYVHGFECAVIRITRCDEEKARKAAIKAWNRRAE